MPGGERRRKKGSRNRGPGVRGASPPRGPSAPGSIARLLAVSQRGTRTRRQGVGHDPERPTRSRPRLAAESAPRAGPRASRRATAGRGFGHRRQAPVQNGRRRTQRRHQHPSRREVGVLISPRPLHHREEASRGGGATFHKRRTVNKPLPARPRNTGRPEYRARGQTQPKMAAGPRPDTPRQPNGNQNDRPYATSPALRDVTRRTGRAGPSTLFRAAADWTGPGPCRLPYSG